MKLKDNRVTKIDPNYKEIRKLDALLTEAGIPHTFQTLYWNNTGDLRGAQIIYPEDGPNRVADVIINGAGYGNEFDLLEMMGLVPETAEPDELTGGSIEGYMTAEMLPADPLPLGHARRKGDDRQCLSCQAA